MKIPAAICTSLILAAAQPFVTAQGGALPPPPVPPVIGAGGPPPAALPAGSIGISGPPNAAPATPPPAPRLDPPPVINVAPVPVAPAPGTAIPSTTIPGYVPTPGTAAPAAVPGMPGNAGNYPMLPPPMPAPSAGQPGYHNKTSNLFYESVPGTAAAPAARSGQEIIRAAKLRVLERHYEETLNQMVQLEKDALAAPPEERAKMEASAQAMQAFLSKLEAELLPLADHPQTNRNTPGLPASAPRLLGTETGPSVPPPPLDTPIPTPPPLDPASPAGTPRSTNIDPTAPAKTAREQSLRLAYDNFNRARQLHEAGAMSEQDFITAQHDFAVAIAQGNSVKTAEARFTEAKQFFDLAERAHTRIDRPDSAAADLETAQTRLQEAQKELERARAAAETLNRPGR